jgi:type IV pilus assembly protein PilA
MSTSTLRPQLQTALIRHLDQKANKKKSLLHKGFTLVELMIVIVIVGILSAVALPNFLNQTTKAKGTECTTKAGGILSQVAGEAQSDKTTADALGLQLAADETTNSKFCTFTYTAMAATSTANITAAGKGDIATKYEGKGCVNIDTAKRDFKATTTDGSPVAAVTAPTCT